ncbi:MAG TPA: hypothetical protein HPP87_04480 [Planctomycetes bacterium]|nr:hypothetical protein [Planctomycetota bacterium]
MSLTDVISDFAHGMGKFIGKSFNALSLFRNALRESAGKLRPRDSSEKIRAIVIEELTHLPAKEAELSGTDFEKRLQLMADTILALQEKINELGFRGPVSETDMFEAMDSLKATELLTEDERAILVTVFRQNIAIQKPNLIDTPIIQNSLSG